ncbi:MAG: flavodoxin family protein [Candidatus Margulisbacteria bacterium]|nr:flavodoxin family protein [Candidatus Margulisiibacteriota bacterium]
MNILIIYKSVHHKNTEKLAQVLAEQLKADLKQPQEVKAEQLSSYDIIGFGSGVFFSQLHQDLLKLVKYLPELNKKVFIFSTRGTVVDFFYHSSLKSLLRNKGAELVGEFSCRGYDTFGLWKFFGGIAKGHPDTKDIKLAINFAETLKSKLKV